MNIVDENRSLHVFLSGYMFDGFLCCVLSNVGQDFQTVMRCNFHTIPFTVTRFLFVRGFSLQPWFFFLPCYFVGWEMTLSDVIEAPCSSKDKWKKSELIPFSAPLVCIEVCSKLWSFQSESHQMPSCTQGREV